MSTYDLECTEGLLLPVWEPNSGVTLVARIGRGVLYLVLLLYVFIGIAMTCDRLMTAIEVITSWKKPVAIKGFGRPKVINVPIWNKTVATLTLQAFGPSSPVIVLAILELFQKNFKSGDLGPGVVIGSAAFTCFLVTAFCMIIVPLYQTRKVYMLRTVYLTAVWALFGYVWLYIIVALVTPRVIDFWEALFTLLLFPVYIIWAYLADRHLWCYKRFDSLSRANVSDIEYKQSRILNDHKHEIADFEETRRDYVEAVRNLRKIKPNEDLQMIEAEALKVILNKGHKSRTYYRLLANRALTGDNVMRTMEKNAHLQVQEATRQSKIQNILIGEDDDILTRVNFEKSHITVMESCGGFEVNILRSGDLLRETVVNYETEDGTAIAGTDYVVADGVVKFMPGMEKQSIKIEIIDDEVYEQDKVFYIKLKPLAAPAALVEPFIATIIILDDDHSGLFSFEGPTFETSESVKTFYLKVERHSGARGKVVVPYHTEDGSAKAGEEYGAVKGELVFDNEDTDNYIGIPINHEASYEKEVVFFVFLDEPYLSPDNPMALEVEELTNKPDYLLTHTEKIIMMGRPKLGQHIVAEVKIRESEVFRTVVDNLAKRDIAKIAVMTRWKEALFDTYAPTPLGEEFEQANMEIYKRGKVTWYAALTHFLTLMWTVILIIVPPAGIHKGISSFLVALLLIILETAIVVDVAMHLACTSGIKEGVIAITIVAFGLGLPEFYADSFVTLNDNKADIPLSSVFASNAIQVYFGLGVSYTIASVYHLIKGTQYEISESSIAGNSLFFCAGSITTYAVLAFRRIHYLIHAELGGPTKYKWICAAILLSVWFIYFTLTVLELSVFLSRQRSITRAGNAIKMFQVYIDETTPLLAQNSETVLVVPVTAKELPTDTCQGLSLEELLLYQNHPTWERVRSALFCSFCFTLLLTFIVACLLSYMHANDCQRILYKSGVAKNYALYNQSALLLPILIFAHMTV